MKSCLKLKRLESVNCLQVWWSWETTQWASPPWSTVWGMGARCATKISVPRSASTPASASSTAKATSTWQWTLSTLPVKTRQHAWSSSSAKMPIWSLFATALTKIRVSITSMTGWMPLTKMTLRKAYLWPWWARRKTWSEVSLRALVRKSWII